MDEYTTEAVESIVEEALAKTTEDEKNPSLPSRNMLRYGETTMLHKLSEILPKYVQHHADTTVIIDELRDNLYSSTRDIQSTKQIQQLHTIVKNCQLCTNRTSDPYLPKWNLTNPDVVFVTEGPLTGSQEDQIFFKALKTAGYTSSRVACTSTLRCRFGDKANAENIHNCSSRYLFNEIQLMNPSLVVCLGSISSSVILGDKIKITAERGKSFWLGPWHIMPTLSQYHAIRDEKLTNQLENDINHSFQLIYGKQ